MLVNLNTKEIWFVTGSQHLYGEEVLQCILQQCKFRG